MPRFIPGLKLCRLFYVREVKPILEREFPALKYSAALIGWGSEILGFDTEVSSDHHWGPRVLLFLPEQDFPRLQRKIGRVLSSNLPYEFMGYSTNFGKPGPNGVRHPVRIDCGPVEHMINVFTVRSFFKARLGFDPRQKISPADWLTFPQQRLLELTSGEVYHDGLGELETVRTKFEFYPKDVWLCMLSAQWTRIAQEEAFVARTGDVGDELGSQIVAARIVRELMKLGFLMERRYAPYSKWLGSGFQRLKISKKLTPLLLQTLSANTWRARELALAKAYTIAAKQHNKLQVTESLSTKTTTYYSRPYRVIFAERFAKALKDQIRDPQVRRLKTDIGSIDQFTDSTNVIEDLDLGKKLKTIYRVPN